jgi:hypothetical protein
LSLPPPLYRLAPSPLAATLGLFRLFTARLIWHQTNPISALQQSVCAISLTFDSIIIELMLIAIVFNVDYRLP